MSSRSLVTFPFSPDVIRRLFEVGFKTQGDLIDFDAESLSNVLQRPVEDCEDILNIVQRSGKNVQVRSLMEVLRDEFKDMRAQKIKTSCKSLDRKLNGGIPIGNVIELYGSGGSGKTQFCYQLCLNVQIPTSFNGLDGEALYIDTESRFKTERIVEMSRYFSRDELKQAEFSENQFLDRIHLIRVSSPEFLRILILYHLEQFLIEHSKVRLVILDSISYQMRYGSEAELDYRTRTREVHLIARQLRTIAHQQAVAVVVTNQVTQNMGTEKLIPALGKTWSFTCSTKLFFERLEDETGTRRVTIVKSRLKGPFKCLFKIEPSGIVQTSVDDSSQASSQ